MAANPLADVSMAAAQLKGAAPAFFDQLCAALKAHEVQSILELGAADGNDIYRAQGKLKSVQQLRKHLVECAELRDTYTRRDNNGRPRTPS